MTQKRIDGNDEPETQQQALRRLILRRAEENPTLDYDLVLDDAVREGIFSLKDVSQAARERWLDKIERVARSIKDKDRLPAIIPVADQPHQGVLLDAAPTVDRWHNVLRRGLQTFGHHFRWSASVRDMEARGEETLPLAELKEGWAEILARYQREQAALSVDREPFTDEEELDEE